jgi:hypothetical protein
MPTQREIAKWKVDVATRRQELFGDSEDNMDEATYIRRQQDETKRKEAQKLRAKTAAEAQEELDGAFENPPAKIKPGKRF